MKRLNTTALVDYCPEVYQDVLLSVSIFIVLRYIDAARAWPELLTASPNKLEANKQGKGAKAKAEGGVRIDEVEGGVK
jgi:hypothetical protein